MKYDGASVPKLRISVKRRQNHISSYVCIALHRQMRSFTFIRGVQFQQDLAQVAREMFKHLQRWKRLAIICK